MFSKTTKKKIMKKFNLFLQDDKTQGKVSSVLLFIAWAYEIPDFEFAILDKVMAFIGAVALANVILLSYKLIEHKDPSLILYLKFLSFINCSTFSFFLLLEL